MKNKTAARIAFLSLFTLLLSAPEKVLAAPPTLHVAAAADLMPVLPSLMKKFTAETHIPVRVSYGASGEEALSIRHHAPYDLFLSADALYPDRLARAGLLDKSSLKTYAKGVLVLWVSRPVLPGPKTLPDLKVIEEPSVKKVAIANPRTAPYGKAAIDCLRSRKMWPRLRAKAVFGNSLAQVAWYLKTGSVSAGFLSKAQAMTLSKTTAGGFSPLPAGCAPPLAQTVAVVSRSRHKKAALRLESFLLGKDAGEIFRSHGYE